MAVDRVPAGAADTPGEPAPVHAGIGIEHLLGRLHPVDGLRRLAPEALRVALPAGIDLVIAARARGHGAAPSSIVLPPPSGCTAIRHSRAWQAVCARFAAIVKPCRRFASRAGATTPPCGNRLARDARLRFDPGPRARRPPRSERRRSRD